MNYSKHYNLLIEKAKNRKLEGYIEKHHIIPRSFGGTNKKYNLVELTAREHFIAHLLLYKMQTNKRKRHQMLTACIMMSGKENFNSRLYEAARKEFGKTHSENIRGENHPMKKRGGWSKEERLKISESKILLYSNKENHPMYGKKHTNESILKNKLSNSLTIIIYDNNNIEQFKSFLKFEEFCLEYDLPFRAFKKSYQTNGEYKLYSKYKNKRASPPRNTAWKKYIGWYAISIAKL